MTERSPALHKARVAALWLVTVLEALLMGVAGSAKFTGNGPEVWGEMFVGWGYPLWFTWVVGGLEVVLAVALLAPRLAAWAALALGAIMTGALATVVIHDSPLGIAGPIINLVALTLIFAGRWRDRVGRPQRPS